MIKFFIVLFSSLLLSAVEQDFILKETNNNNLLVEFELEKSMLVSDKGEYISLNSSKGYSTIIGMPKLPMYSSMIMLDPTKEYEISYTVKESRILNDVKVVPNQIIVNGLERETIQDIDNTFYNSNTAYPYTPVSLSEPMVMRDIVVSNIVVVPFRYIPSSRQLEIFDSIDIHVEEVGQREDVRVRDLPKSRVFENIYKNTILNYNEQTRDEEYQTPAILYICPGSLETNSNFEQLVEWRRQRGYIVYTASTSNTGTSSSSIKNYIQNAYETFSPAPEYVALVGDVGGSYSLPTYYEDYGHDSYGNECEGDHPYSQLDGSDLLPEVLIGRMSIRSTSELSAVVYKIINYEKATYLGNLGNYFDNAAMFGDPSTSGNSCAITKEAVAGLLENHGFGDVYLKTSGSSWSSAMTDKLTEGVLFFNYRGYLGMSGFSTGDVDNANNGYKLPFATVLTCGTGSFSEDQTCMSEKFFRAGSAQQPKGGVAAIGTATWNTHTLFNNIVDLGIYHGLLADKVGTAGAALASGKFALYNTYPTNPYQWISSFTHWNNLMGDPATHLWTDTPKVLTVSHPDQIPFGTNYFDVVVEDDSGNPVEDAMVTLLVRFGTNPTSIYTNSEGVATFELGPFDNGILTITVTKDNCKPYSDTTSIVSENTSINLATGDDLAINDGFSGDGLVTAGDNFGLSIPLHNFGSSTVNGITATLTAESDLVVIENSTVSYGSMSPDQTLYGDDFSLSLSASAVQNEDLGLILTINDSQNNEWSSMVELDVYGSHLIPTTTLNINPGQTSNLNINLSNQGSLAAQNVTAQLSFSGDLITVNDATGSWGNIGSGSTLSSSDDFNITASSDIINGTQLLMDLTIQTESGYSRTESFSIRIGNLSVVDPLGPDAYGYYIYDSNDIDYDLAPDYNWIDISSGLGTNLNLSNSGDGNWSGNGPLETVNLPFTFRFYGVDYNQMTVCTNGWISLGSTTSEAFRNYPIPGAGGPSPMIAAFWDDLETGNNGDVFVYNTNEYVIVQWDNMRTNWASSSETFQVILYNDSALPYGDNSIKIQYDDFNNTSVGSFSSYPPIHGSYATIGIENHLATDGLQYSYNNNYPTAAMTLSDNKAIYITTQAPITLPAPQLDLSDSSLNFEVASGSLDTQELILSNDGEDGSVLNYTVSAQFPDVESPFQNSGGGPDSFGYFWSDSGISSDIDYNWIDINGEQVSFPSNDDGTSLIDIGFEFPFYGDVYTQFRINPNGWIGFGDDNDEWYNSNIPSTDYPTNAIFGFWDDLNPVNDNCNDTCSGNVYYESNGEQLVVWFDTVAHWFSEDYVDSYYDFQIVINSDGDIEINHRTLTGIYSATVGTQNATGTVATQIDVYNGDYFSNNTSYKIKKPFSSSWMLLNGNLSGSLENGEQTSIEINVNAEGVPEGEYTADILVVSDSENLVVPVYLTVLNEQGMVGDINGDMTLNVLDIVSLVNLILGDGEYDYNADLNQDGSIDVVDVVQLVNLVLNQ